MLSIPTKSITFAGKTVLKEGRCNINERVLTKTSILITLP